MSTIRNQKSLPHSTLHKLQRNMNNYENHLEIKQLLDSRVLEYNQLEFIETDPIQIPHRFTKKEDIEIAGFLTATISWGQRKSILKSANSMMEQMENSPSSRYMHGQERSERTAFSPKKPDTNVIHPVKSMTGSDKSYSKPASIANVL